MMKTIFTITGNIGFILILWLVFICYNVEDNENILTTELLNYKRELLQCNVKLNSSYESIVDYQSVMRKFFLD